MANSQMPFSARQRHRYVFGDGDQNRRRRKPCVELRDLAEALERKRRLNPEIDEASDLVDADQLELRHTTATDSTVPISDLPLK